MFGNLGFNIVRYDRQLVSFRPGTRYGASAALEAAWMDQIPTIEEVSAIELFVRCIRRRAGLISVP
jgi:hypothetical protein